MYTQIRNIIQPLLKKQKKLPYLWKHGNLGTGDSNAKWKMSDKDKYHIISTCRIKKLIEKQVSQACLVIKKQGQGRKEG